MTFSVRAAAISGETKPEERRRIIAAYQGREIDALINCFVLTDGFDAPDTRGVIIGRRVSNEATWVQIGGRGLRPAPGKTMVKVVDLYGSFQRMGLIEDESRVWTLDGTGPKRVGTLPPVVRCPACLAWGPPSSRCPGCGRTTPPAPPPRVRAKDLIEVRAGEAEATKRATLVRYVREAMGRGHSPWSAAHRFGGVYGSKPTSAEMRAVIAEVERSEMAKVVA